MREYVLFSQHAKQFVRHAFIEFILMLMRLNFQKGNQQSSSKRSLNSNWKVKRFFFIADRCLNYLFQVLLISEARDKEKLPIIVSAWG